MSDEQALISEKTLRPEEELFCLYVGKNADKFLPLFQARAEKKRPKTSFNLIVFLLGPVWFFYRKMYLCGALLIILPLAVSFLVEAMPKAGFAGISIALGFFANLLYVDLVRKKIAKYQTLGLSDDALKQKLVAAGGTSPIAAWVVGTVMIGTVVALIYFLATLSLPTCDDSDLQNTVKELFRDSLARSGIDASAASVGNFKLKFMDDDVLMVCSFVGSLGDEHLDMDAHVVWDNKYEGLYQVQTMPAAGEALQ